MTVDQKTRRKLNSNDEEKPTTAKSTSFRIFLVIILLVIVAALSWPLIVQPCSRYLRLVLENIPNQELGKEVKKAIQLPSFGLYLAVGLSGISKLFLLAGAIYTSTESWNTYNSLNHKNHRKSY